MRAARASATQGSAPGRGDLTQLRLLPIVDGMYAKILMRYDSIDAPAIMVIEPKGDGLVERLLALGWAPYGEGAVSGAGHVLIEKDLLEVVIGDETVLRDDTNPGSPMGWWDAVSAIDDRVLLFFVRHGAVNMRGGALAEEVAALRGTHNAALALLPIRH